MEREYFQNELTSRLAIFIQPWHNNRGKWKRNQVPIVKWLKKTPSEC